MSLAPTRGLALAIGETLFTLEPGRIYRVGRGADNEIRVNHGTVSETHCRIVSQGASVVVEDLGSEHGTVIDGRRIQRAAIVPGQRIRLGGIEVELRCDRTAIAAVPKIAAAAPWRHRQPPTFPELMADELRRAPWFTLSLLIHGLILLVFYLLAEPPPQEDRGVATLTLQKGEEHDNIEDEDAPDEEMVVEKDQLELELQNDVFEDSFAPEAAVDSFDDLEDGVANVTGSSGWMTTVKKTGKGILGEGTVGGGGFKKTVSEIRRSGLEIMFVFDSTGSMDSILNGTKNKISQMVELLHALVPDARIGLITYRDNTSSEEYVTRAVPLSLDVYRVINFMHMIEAGGGGDRPEAVLDGLRTAFTQQWGRKARRVIVLIGDAPAHKHDERKLRQAIRSFSSDGRSFVHTIVTSPHGSGPLPKDTQQSFGKIAEAGRGECLGFEDEAKVMQQVLSLAFGREYRKNLDEASRILQSRKETIATTMLDLVHRRDVKEIARRLKRTPVSDDLVKALRKSKSKAIAHLMVDVLTDSTVHDASRQAAAHVLQEMLGMNRPPNDPQQGGRIPSRRAEALHKRIDRQLLEE